MADVAARREARRRKILQNSENRMNRLLGKTTDKEDDTAESPVSTDESETVLPPSEEDIPAGGDLLVDQTNMASHRSLDTETTRSYVQPRPPLSSLRTGTESTGKAASNSSSQPLPKAHTIQEVQNLLQILENMRIGSCVVLAFIVRWVLSYGYGLFYFQTIFPPFILLEAGIYSFHYTYMKEVALPHSSSLMSGALMLSGIKPELVAIYNRTMGYVSAITEDFALYLFTFFVFNAVMT